MRTRPLIKLYIKIECLSIHLFHKAPGIIECISMKIGAIVKKVEKFKILRKSSMVISRKFRSISVRLRTLRMRGRGQPVLKDHREELLKKVQSKLF